jgi:hypothetical protein
LIARRKQTTLSKAYARSNGLAASPGKKIKVFQKIPKKASLLCLVVEDENLIFFSETILQIDFN